MSSDNSKMPLTVEIFAKMRPEEVVSLIVRLTERVSELEMELSRQIARNVELEKQVVELKARLNRKSSNSNKPPSSDSPFKDKAQGNGEAKPRSGHRGHSRKLLEATATHPIMPETCQCGCASLGEASPYHTHQVVELPEIKLDVDEYVLYKAQCPACGKVVRAEAPRDKRTGYGPRLSALVAELVGIHGDSRRGVQDFLRSVFGLSMSQGAIQKTVVRAGEALAPHYEAIGRAARSADVNHVDETSWKTRGRLKWLWTMAGASAVFFKIHRHRSRAAFEELAGNWRGFIVSDGYRLYLRWPHGRQTCLAHLVRRAVGVSEHPDPEIAAVGEFLLRELRRLCHMAEAPPRIAEWNRFHARLTRLFRLNGEHDDEAGKLVRQLMKEGDSLWAFLDAPGVEPTNNRAERSLRFPVIWRRRSFGTRNETGDRFVERLISLRQTCRIQSRSSFHVLVNAFSAHLDGSSPDLSFIHG